MNSKSSRFICRAPWLMAVPVLAVMSSVCFSAMGEEAQPEGKSAAKTNDPSTELTQELKWLKAERPFITSVSKRAEDPFTAAAAVSVITSEDIHRSGARSIPEALRLAPGIGVAQMDANKWAIGTRGFADRYADKLLVLIDGRSVYTSHFGGVFWETLNYPLADVDRIEIIRGPGGSLYGDNAVNGVINIITRDAKETEGGLVTGGGGTAERGFGSIRYGIPAGKNGAVRAYVDYFNRANFPGGRDGWDMLQGGFRGDWDLNQDHFTLQGDSYSGHISYLMASPTFTPPYVRNDFEDFVVTGYNALARWTHLVSEDSDLKLQAYYDRAHRGGQLDTTEEKFDVDFQHRFKLPLRQDFMYGLGYRYYPEEKRYTTSFLSYYPTSRKQQLISSFLSDEIALVEDRLRLTLGTKVEHWDSTGWNVQPNARLTWLITPHQTAWASVSRSVLVPSANDRDSFFDPVPQSGAPRIVAGLPVLPRGRGNPDAANTEVMAYEVGYRIQPQESVSIDVAAFYSDYRRLLTGAIGATTFQPAPAPHLSTELFSVNAASAHVYGFEVASTWHAAEHWRLEGSYALLRMQVNDPLGLTTENAYPRHQISLRSSMDLPANLMLDLWGRFVDEMPDLRVRSYFDLDARLSWKLDPTTELAIVGQNLISPRRIEAGENAFVKSQITPVPRGVYLEFSKTF